MADRIIPETTAPTHYVELTDREGRLVLLPLATVRSLRSVGQTSITMTIDLTSEPSQPWLTVTEAARLHLEDVDGMTLERAKVKICRACEQGIVLSNGKGIQRRIEPNSLAAWRLKERERNLAADELVN